MEGRDLPDVVKATFGVGSPVSVKLLTSATLLHKEHSTFWPVSMRSETAARPHSILHFASQKYHSKSQIPDPDPRRIGDLGKQ